MADVEVGAAAADAESGGAEEADEAADEAVDEGVAEDVAGRRSSSRAVAAGARQVRRRQVSRRPLSRRRQLKRCLWRLKRRRRHVSEER